MKLRQLFENIYDVNEGGEEFDNSLKTIGVCFGRWNPPHKGHKAVWQHAASNPIWYVGTNKSTAGPKDPVPYDVKLQLMQAVWPKVAGHVIPEQSLLTLASRIYQEHGDNVHLKVYTDEEWLYKALSQYNGVEKEHGMYKFIQIDWVKTERLASATNLRAAVRADDRKSFYHDMGIKPSVTVKVNGRQLPVFDVVAHYLNQYPEKAKKVVAEENPNQQLSLYNPNGKTYRQQPMPTLGNDPVDHADRYGDSDDSYEENFDKIHLKKMIAKYWDVLDDREQDVLKKRFWKGMTLDEVGDVYKLSKNRIRQIEARAFRKLKQKMVPDNVTPDTVDLDESGDPQVRKHMIKKLVKHHGWDLSDLELASDAEIQSEYNKLPAIQALHKKLRINEVAMPLSESSQAKITKRKQQSTAGLNTYGDGEHVSGDYTAYRLGMAVAGANGKDPIAMKAKSWIGKKKSTHPYTQEEQDMLKQAYEAVGAEYTDLNAGDMKSKELDSTHKVSPVAAPKRNKYGV